jgi:hypothetical protein
MSVFKESLIVYSPGKKRPNKPLPQGGERVGVRGKAGPGYWLTIMTEMMGTGGWGTF